MLNYIILVPAAVDGAWSQWSQYGPCSQPCLGTRRRTRTCTDPAPEFGGNACEGVNTQDQYCNDCVGNTCVYLLIYFFISDK